ncbi:hypothetical protein [Peribacillus simplex]|uniref:Prepilin type IV endopeptidase peptidase domain-containing protein n=1 Tax=Peribacillus simplex TaxID=1478 RepID=A0AAW7IAG9_9BACI|nr:hypothetical protein [Peribacillus simplex]MDM5451943.1 hypothetical protein [Peribacillus simplex]
MNVTDLIILSVVIGLINDFKDKKFNTNYFFKTPLTFFTSGLIIIGNIFLNDLLDKYLPSEEYGIWLFGGLLLLYSIYTTIKGFSPIALFVNYL